MDPFHLAGYGSVSDDPDPGQGVKIPRKLFIFEQNFNKCKDENAKFLLNVQGFGYSRRFLIRQRKSKKKFRKKT